MAPRNEQPPPPPPSPPQSQSKPHPHSQSQLQRPSPHRFLSTVSKRSYLSHSSSFEADDERSSSAASSAPSERFLFYGSTTWDLSMSGSRAERRVSPPRYPGEDTRYTSSRELAGWYAYAFASEPYVICAISSFIPILLESLARENGVLLSDQTKPCAGSDNRNAGAADGQCIIRLLGVEINTASFAMYTFSVSVLLQALLVVSISCAADHGNYRKKLLLAFAGIGSASVMCFVFVTKSTYILGAALAIISNTSFGASLVLLNSFLPLLVRHHPTTEMKLRALEDDLSGDEGQDSEDTITASAAEAFLPADDEGEGGRHRGSHVDEEVTAAEMSLSTQISAKGIGIGYSAGLVLQCVGIIMIFNIKDGTWAQRLVLLLVGAWWAIATIPAAMWLRPRPGPPLPTASSNQNKIQALLSYIVGAWKALFRTVAQARRLMDILLFLCAWFLLSDAVATTSSTAIMFAKTQLHMKVWALGLISVISTMAGVIGAFAWTWLARRLRLKPNHALLAIIALLEIIPLYGLLGYLPFVRNWGVIGLQQPWEMFPLAAVYGFALGGLGAYTRSLYGELIPPGNEAAFYALYAITDKGSSIFGPAIVGGIIDSTGEIRPAFWFLAALIGAPAFFIYFVNVERGKREGEKLAEANGGFSVAEAGAGSRHGHSDNGRGEEMPILARHHEEDEP